MDGEKKCPGDDFVSVLSVNEDRSLTVLRHRPDHTVIPAVLEPVRDGKPIHSELIGLKPRPDGNFSVETLYEPESARTKSAETRRSEGPAMVNSRGYRDGWEGIWGKSGSNGAPN